jgi:hypothetical protein
LAKIGYYLCFLYDHTVNIFEASGITSMDHRTVVERRVVICLFPMR